MKKQPSNEQILKKIKELIKQTQDIEIRLSEVEYILDINRKYQDRVKGMEEAKARKEREEAEDRGEEGKSGSMTTKNKPVEMIDEIDTSSDEFMNEVKGVVDELSKSKIGQSEQFKGPLDSLRKMIR